MKLPQFRVRTLLLLTAIMGVLFVACAKWPVTETTGRSGGLTLTAAPNSGGGLVFTGSYIIERPPTPSEWAIRVGIASGALLVVFALVGMWRTRKAKAVGDQKPSP
jgi:Ni/Fe-hydrogenase subunit HybB-like protein